MKDALWAAIVAALLIFLTVKVGLIVGFLATAVVLILDGRGWSTN